MSNIFDKLAPLYVSKDALDHLLDHSRSKHCLRKAKNFVFSLFYILIDIPKRELQPPSFPITLMVTTTRYIFPQK